MISPIHKKKLLIVGCGRSGTLYSAEVFRALGLDILHERDQVSGRTAEGKDGFASWFLTVNDPAPPYGPDRIGCEFEMSIHLVRHPLKVIASFAQFILQTGVKSAEFVERYVPDLRAGLDSSELSLQQKLVLQASRYWFHWNLMSEQVGRETIRLEKMREELPRLCDRLNLSYSPAALETVSPRTNERTLFIKDTPWIVEWKDIAEMDPNLYHNIRQLASRYGYEK